MNAPDPLWAFLAIAAGLAIIAGAGIWNQHTRARQEKTGRGPAEPATPLAVAVLDANRAAEQLQQAIAVGKAGDLIAAAYAAERTAIALAILIRQREQAAEARRYDSETTE